MKYVIVETAAKSGNWAERPFRVFASTTCGSGIVVFANFLLSSATDTGPITFTITIYPSRRLRVLDSA